MINCAHPDLTQHPPRSPRVRLGGFAQLPRLPDKARGTVAGKNGEYVYGAMMDRHFFDFTGIDAAALLAAVQTSGSDSKDPRGKPRGIGKDNPTQIWHL